MRLALITIMACFAVVLLARIDAAIRYAAVAHECSVILHQ